MIMLAHRDVEAAVAMHGAELEGLALAAHEVELLELLSPRAGTLAPLAKEVQADVLEILSLAPQLHDQPAPRQPAPFGAFRSAPPVGLRPVDEEVGDLLREHMHRLPAWHRVQAQRAWSAGSRTITLVVLVHGLAASEAELAPGDESRLSELVSGASRRAGDRLAVRVCRAGTHPDERRAQLRRLEGPVLTGRHLLLLDCHDGLVHLRLQRRTVDELLDLVGLAAEALHPGDDRFRFDHRERMHALPSRLARLAREFDEGPVRSQLRRMGAWR